MEHVLPVFLVLFFVVAAGFGLVGLFIHYTETVIPRRKAAQFITNTLRTRRDAYPFADDQAFFQHIANKVLALKPAPNFWTCYTTIVALCVFFRGFRLYGASFPNAEEMVRKYAGELDMERMQDRLGHHGWGDFETESNLWQRKRLWRTVDYLINAVIQCVQRNLPPSAYRTEPSFFTLRLEDVPKTIEFDPEIKKHTYEITELLALKLRTYQSFNEELYLAILSQNLRSCFTNIDVPDHTWFEHCWITAPPGTGKSNLLSYLIDKRLDEVAAGKASVIVMESKTDLIKGLRGIKEFETSLKDRLIIIDADDVDYPIALNLFDIGGSTENLSSRDREAYHNATVSMLDYIFRALLGTELTSRQSTLFNFSIQLLMAVKGANLDTMIALMSPKGIQREEFQQALKVVDEDTRQFFALKFEEYKATKEQVVDRLFAVKRIRALSRMFSATKTRLNLFDEMGKGKVILINAPKDLLQEEGVEIFSRFFLAMILLAAQKRASLPEHQRLPVYVFIDEAQDVIRRDDKLPVLLDQARGFKVSMTLAHQRLDQMTAPVLNALYGSTAIKMASRLSDANASALARNMGTTPDFILKQPQYSFATHVRGVTETAAVFKPPHVDFAKMPRLSDPEKIRRDMRDKYAIQPEPVEPPRRQTGGKRTGDEEA
jgi:hypothetical protein